MGYAYLDNYFIDALSKVFQTIFDKVFTPVLTSILEVFIKYFTDIILDLYSEFLIILLSMLCSLIDFIENIFNVFAGMAPVQAGGEYKYLIDAIFEMDSVSMAFLYITVMAVAVCFVFTIIKTVKSISDMVLEDRNPVSKVLKDGLKACITFMLIPFLCIFMLRLSAAITSQINHAFAMQNEGNSASVGTVLFLSVSMEGIPASENPSLMDDVRKEYMTGVKDYRDIEQVKYDFDSDDFNYIAGFTSGVVLILVLGSTVLLFVRRIFEVLLLYLVSPLFVSTIPLDDGATFAKWREMFIAKFFSGFGSVFTMKLYLMVIPAIAGSNIVLYDPSLPNGVIINNILKIFLIVGGAWAVYKSQTTIMQIISPQASIAERETASFITGMIAGGVSTAATAATAAATGGTSLAAKGAAGAVAGGAMNAMGNSGGTQSSQNEQAYRG